MIKQFRITTADIIQSSSDDCVLPPDDLVHKLKATSIVGGIGGDAILAEYARASHDFTLPTIDKGAIQRTQNIRPGTPEWFKLWFSRPDLTGEQPYEN